MIARLLGLPRGDEERFFAWAVGLLAFPFDPEQARRASAEFTSTCSRSLPSAGDTRRTT